MAFNVAQGTAEEFLFKPVKIKNVVVGIKSLRDNQIIDSDTANAVMNLIFTDITTDVNFIIPPMEDVQKGIHAYSGYLYKTTDELTAEMYDDLANVAYVGEIRTELSNIFDDMSAGYASSAELSLDINKLKADFYSGSASTFWANWELYADSTQFTYTEATMSNIWSKVNTANTNHYGMKTKVANLISTYPHISIEPDPYQPLVRKLAAGVIWAVASGSNASPTLRFHPDNAANAPQMDISFSVGPEGILLDKAGSYTVKFQDNTTGGPALQLNLQDASATSLATLNSGNAHTLSAPPQLRSAVIVSRTLATAGDLITGLNTFIVG
jgi:hypothetical protein